MGATSVGDYRPAPSLDEELAGLGYAAVQGWSDHRPITGPLVRSWLRPFGMAATTLAVHRDEGGRLLAAAALRWSATLEGTGRLWGPVVHPEARGRRLGAELLTTLTGVVATHPGVRVSTAEIPELRKAGWSLFDRAGWSLSGGAYLLRRPLVGGVEVPVTVPVRGMERGEYLDPSLSALFAAARPHLGHAMARDTYSRWSADVRFTPDGLLLAEGPHGLVGAALVYPLSHDTTVEAPEALLADLITLRQLDPATAHNVRTSLIAAALHAGARAGATVARSVVDDPDVVHTLTIAGFEIVDRVRYYTAPSQPPLR